MSTSHAPFATGTTSLSVPRTMLICCFGGSGYSAAICMVSNVWSLAICAARGSLYVACLLSGGFFYSVVAT